MNKQTECKECEGEGYIQPIKNNKGSQMTCRSCKGTGKEQTTNPLIQNCPNCTGEEPENNIEPNEDGSCGVCSGTKMIEWKKVGKLLYQE
jgi:DnaJ-class molecular chaperone